MSEATATQAAPTARLQQMFEENVGAVVTTNGILGSNHNRGHQVPRLDVGIGKALFDRALDAVTHTSGLAGRSGASGGSAVHTNHHDHAST